MQLDAFSEFFSDLHDPRQSAKIAYPLFDILFLAAPMSEFVGVDARDHGLWCFRYFSAERSYVFSCLKGRCSPVETSEEKAQREENAFVGSFGNGTALAYREGLRDAYRKIKGGE